MRRFLSLFVLLVTMFAFAACGGGDDDGGSASGTSEEPAGGGDTDFSGKGSGDFCAKVKVLNEDESLDIDANSPEDEQKAQAKKSLAALDDLLDDAPKEIKGDVRVVVEGVRPLLEAVADGKDLSQLSEEDQKRFEGMNEQEFENAGVRVNAYVEKVCEIDTDDDGDTDGIAPTDTAPDATTGNTTDDTATDGAGGDE
ncbi:MAG TPA: hypothetical protein VM345_06060 [Acidimicrobiales bacterium]|jgi:hypothetical protein|nr:hypothetical protein [Acidimicrobiales bacterium]